MDIKKYDDFLNEEAGWVKNIVISTLLALGINKVQAQQIQDDQKKLEIIDYVDKFNKNPKNISDLKLDLSKSFDNPDKIISKYLHINGDRSITVNKLFIDNLIFDVNVFTKSTKITYKIKF